MTAEEIRYIAKAVPTFENVYKVTCPSKRQKEIRLKELETWDTSGNSELERKAKIIALTNLLKKELV